MRRKRLGLTGFVLLIIAAIAISAIGGISAKRLNARALSGCEVLYGGIPVDGGKIRYHKCDHGYKMTYIKVRDAGTSTKVGVRGTLNGKTHTSIGMYKDKVYVEFPQGTRSAGDQYYYKGKWRDFLHPSE